MLSRASAPRLPSVSDGPGATFSHIGWTSARLGSPSQKRWLGLLSYSGDVRPLTLLLILRRLERSNTRTRPDLKASLARTYRYRDWHL